MSIEKPSFLWPMVLLSDVLTHCDEKVELDDSTEYVTITVKRRYGGLQERERLQGHQIKTKKQFRLIPGAFIISRIQCWHQAFAIVPDNVPKNMIASTNYDQFCISPHVDRQFFWWLSHLPFFIKTVRNSAFGVVIEKMVFDREKWLRNSIPLPSLEKQKEIVAKLENFLEKTNEARKLIAKETEELKMLTPTVEKWVFNKSSSKSWSTRKLGEVAPINMGQSPPGHSYNEYKEGVPLLNGPTEFGDRHPSPIQWTTMPTKLCKKGDILLCVRGATTGKMNWADKEYCIGRGIAALTPRKDLCISDYVYAFVETQTKQMLSLASGSTFPNLPESKLKNLDIPIPPMVEQTKIINFLASVKAKIYELEKLEAKSRNEADELENTILYKVFTGNGEKPLTGEAAQ